MTPARHDECYQCQKTFAMPRQTWAMRKSLRMRKKCHCIAEARGVICILQGTPELWAIHMRGRDPGPTSQMVLSFR